MLGLLFLAYHGQGNSVNTGRNTTMNEVTLHPAEQEVQSEQRFTDEEKIIEAVDCS